MNPPASATGATHGRRGLSLRAQLTLWFLAISLVIHVTLIVVLVLYQRMRLGESVDRKLRSFAASAAAVVEDHGGAVTADQLRDFREQSRVFAASDLAALVIFDARGAVIASTLSPPPTPAEAGVQGGLRPGSDVQRTRIEALRNDDGSDWARALLVPVRAGSGEPRLLWAAVNEPSFMVPVQVLTLVLPAEIIAVGVAGWMIAGLAIRPIAHFRKLAATLAPDTLEQDMAVTSKAKEVGALEADLRETRLKLREALHAQDRFMANVSHELKTPIAILLTEAQTFRIADADVEMRRFVNSVVEEMRRLGRMIESFLMLTKVRGGGSIPNPRPYEVHEFVMEAMGDCRLMARNCRVEIVAQLTEGTRPLPVTGDPELLRVMVDNLVRNAVRYSRPGGKVIVKVDDRDQECVLTVRDFGQAIPEQILSRVFDRSFQAAGTLESRERSIREEFERPYEARRERGYGLGLAIAQGIAELHGGRIVVVNGADGGCEFSVRLPLSSPTGPGSGNPSGPPPRRAQVGAEA